MQGVFNVNWDDVLEPGVDEKTSKLFHKGNAKTLNGRRKKRGGGGSDAGSGSESGSESGSSSASPPRRRRRRPEPEDAPEPRPPDLRILLKHEERQMDLFIVPGRLALRPGKLGHYTAPFTVSKDNLCAPFPEPEATPNDVIYPGTPGYPWPPESILQGMLDDSDKAGYFTGLLEWSNNRLKDKINIADNIRLLNTSIGDELQCLFSIRSTNVTSDWKMHLNQEDTYADHNMPPDPTYSKDGHHYISARCPLDGPTNYHEIGVQTLKPILQDAEELDYEFSKKIQGLIGASQDHVWACLDPDFVPSDRALMLSEFSKSFISDFLGNAKGDPDARSVATEQLQQHKAFAQEWVRKHYKTLTPTVTSPAEALVMDLYPQLKTRMPREGRLSPTQLARFFMRHPKFSPAFAQALQHYMQFLDNARGGRNPSYKQVTQTGTMRALQFKAFTEHLERERTFMAGVYRENVNPGQILTNIYLVDWHHVVGKLPEVHRHYPRSGEVFLGGGKRRWEAGRPPWMYSRS